MTDLPFSSQHPSLYISDLIVGSSVDSDTTDSGPYYGFYATAAGTLKFNTLAGTTVEFPVAANQYYFIGVSRLWETGHTTVTTGDIWLAR